jgi:hypothetical protein
MKWKNEIDQPQVYCALHMDYIVLKENPTVYNLLKLPTKIDVFTTQQCSQQQPHPQRSSSCGM